MTIEMRWMTIRQAAEYLGLHPKSLYRACLEGKVPSVKQPGIGRRVDKLALDRLLESRTIGAERLTKGPGAEK